MSSKRNWSNQEDDFLRNQAGKKQNRNWIKISLKLNEKFGGEVKSAKQCRERFINHASNPSELPFSNQWSKDQIKRLYELYSEYGARWTKIANQLANKSENIVKNKFYCSLRKFVRKLNNFLKSGKNKYKKQIRYDSILRVLEAFDCFPDIPQHFKTISYQIRQKILQLTELTIQDKQIDGSILGQLAQDINKFNLQTRSYKARKPKYFQSDHNESLKSFQTQTLKHASEIEDQSVCPMKSQSKIPEVDQNNDWKNNLKEGQILTKRTQQQNEKQNDIKNKQELLEEELRKDFYFSMDYGSLSGNSPQNDIFLQMFPEDFKADQGQEFLQ